MPTELKNGTGELLRSKGQEYGATTGRARRCGWLDLPALKYSAEINEFDKIVLMKLDILSNLEEIKVCTEYKYNENSTKKREFQPENAIPVYSTLPGWGVDITNIKKFENLPTEAQNYVKFIEQHIEVPVEIIGVGPGRDEIVAR
jgi:adenylosuccinate synthase